MSKRRQSEILRFLLAAMVALGALGSECSGVPQEASSAPCTAQVAQIAVWDGQIQKVCGCGGTDGEFAPVGTPLTCTFALGKTIFVSYQGPFLQHQIVAVGTPEIPTSPVFDPNSKIPARSHAFTPTAAGTYSFKDQFDQTITGSFVVTP